LREATSGGAKKQTTNANRRFRLSLHGFLEANLEERKKFKKKRFFKEKR
jgi:hypothetical protein